MNFSSFCDFVFHSPDLLSDEHYRSQHLYVFGKSNHNPFDYICKLETLAEDISRIHHITGIHIPLPHLNKSGAGNTYKNYVNHPSLARLIKKRYKEDFRLFEYDLA